MTSARAFDGGFYSPYSETPIYDRLVAERGRPEIGPMHVPVPDFTGLGHYSRFGDRPALPALPALPSSYSGSSYGGSSYSSPSPSASTGGYAAAPVPYSGAQQAPSPAPNGNYGAGYGAQGQYAPAPPQQYAQPLPQGYRPAPGAPQGYRPAPSPPQQYTGQVPPPRIPGRPDPGGFQDRY
ncbi:hypothetical protein LO772_27545 [Yinghuangia sp. ASG 101]|uniref:DUF6643 family protein n=1 Tax=Yinghuangia sp. ASG 101 TaxID=2896848 RepID=UPI001E51CE3D|nr:DUF6643 family protein [Yinghuangia sp. ASG 101]UGQ10565.1 hypothetical protein LO772_27545 [Yinghuangia sp. ASG 101]